LSKSEHEVVCFGIGAVADTLDKECHPCHIWAVGYEDLTSSLSLFLAREKPDVLFIHKDIGSVKRWIENCRKIGWSRPIVSHFVFDAIPVRQEYLEVLQTLHSKLTPTHTVANYLSTVGIDDVIVSPHGIDHDVFKPLKYRNKLRAVAGFMDKFVIGVFGRNAERKQHPRIMMAISQLRKMGKASNLLLYLHCQPKDHSSLNGWNLQEVARDLQIEDIVLFPYENFDQLSGSPYYVDRNESSFSFDEVGNVPRIPREFSYVERLNCCDLIINSSSCGGFELGIIEAQACGIPVAVTNDRGNMAEVAGGGAFLLEPSHMGIWKTGGQQFFISPYTIAQAILQLQEGLELREDLVQKGRRNASKYAWDKLGYDILKVLHAL
jgi:glycosyltransferase involved in cell wall biosynthesis